MYTQRHFTQPRTAVQHRITDPELAAATLARQRARLQLRALRDDPPDDPHTHHATQQATQRCQSTTSRARQLKRSRWKKSRQPLRKKSLMLGGDASLPQPGASTWREPRWPKKEEHGSSCTNLFPARSSMMNEADERRPQTTLSTPWGSFGPSAVWPGGDRPIFRSMVCGAAYSGRPSFVVESAHTVALGKTLAQLGRKVLGIKL